MSRDTCFACLRFKIADDLLRISLIEDANSHSHAIERSVAELPISVLRAQDDERVQKSIGAVVISAIERATDGALNISSSDGRVRAMKSVATVLETQSDLGHPDAQFSLATLYLNLSAETGDAEMLEAAEELLHKSANQGYESARDFLDGSWESIKAEFRRRIEAVNARGAKDA